MKICVFASGSGGNCTLVQSGRTNILIDAGISRRRIVEALSMCALTIKDIDGVLITHEHSDHVSALKMLIKYERPDIYAPRTVANRLRGMFPGIEASLCQIPVGEGFSVGDIEIRAFHTPHDTDESVGYTLRCGGSFALATDMGCVTDEIRQNLLGCDSVLIESNHDEQMLSYGPYPVQLKRRILSDRGHLSNRCCAEFARELADNGTRKIILGHLSKENNTPRLAESTVSDALVGTDAELYVAPPWGCLEITV